MSQRHRAARLLAATVAAGALGWALFRCVDVDVNLSFDPRYDAERFLRASVAPGDTLEIHGKNVYLPRLPDAAQVTRVGPEPADSRNPLPNVTEVVAPLGDVAERQPRWIVVAQGWAGHFMSDAHPEPGATGRIFAGTEIANTGDADVAGFFRDLFAGRLGYRCVHVAAWTSRIWPRVDIQGSVAPTVWIFQRQP